MLKTVPEAPTPDIYHFEKSAAHSMGFILMQDLSGSCKSVDFHDTLTEQLVLELARHLARFQAGMAHLERQEWRHLFADSADQLIQAMVDILDKFQADGLLTKADPSEFLFFFVETFFEFVIII